MTRSHATRLPADPSRKRLLPWLALWVGLSLLTGLGLSSYLADSGPAALLAQITSP